MTMTPAQIDKMLFPGACKMMASGPEAMLTVRQEYKRRKGKDMYEAFGLETIDEMLSGAGLVSKELKPMSQSETMKKAQTHIDRARAYFKQMTGKEPPTRAKQETVYVNVTTEDLMQQSKNIDDDSEYQEAMDTIDEYDAEITDTKRRIEAIQMMADKTAELAALKKRLATLQAAKNKQRQADDGFDPMYPGMQVPVQGSKQWSPVFGNMFNKDAVPPDNQRPTIESQLRDAKLAEKHKAANPGRNVFDSFFRDMDVPVQRQTQQAAPTTVESLTRRQRK